MTTEGKLVKIAENEQKVYKAGKETIVKIHPEATVSGSYIFVDDVSELPHEVKCKISGVADPTSVKVIRSGKNLLCYPYAHTTKTVSGITFTDNGDGSITVNGTGTANASFQLIATNKHRVRLLKGVTYSFNIGFVDSKQKIYGYVTYDNGTADTAGAITYVYDYGTTGGNTFTPTENVYLNSASIIVLAGNTFNDAVLKPQLELWEKTEFEPYRQMQTLTPNSDGTVGGMTSVSPYMNIFTDTEGANIEATYRRSKGMEVEKEQFYNNFKQGYITDSISFEWMTGLVKTNTALIVGGLSDNATGQTLTLNLAGVNKAYETSSGANDGATSAAFAELVATKPNWTITLI